MPTRLWSSELPYVVVVALVLTALLLRTRPGDRASTLNTLWLFVLGVAGQAAGFAAAKFGIESAARVLELLFRVVWTIALIRMAGFVLFRYVLPRLGRGLPRIIEDLALVAVYVAYGLSQLRHFGVDLTGILATSAIITAVLAFAMQDTLGNIIGGLAIQLDNSVRVGDWVQLENGPSGRVVDIRWRSTALETRDWVTVVVPNSQLMKNRFNILGRREGAPLQWRRGIPFMVDPAVPPARVLSMVDEEMREIMIANVARAPAPACVLLDFIQGNLRYELRYYLTDLLEDEPTDSAVRIHLFASLQRAGIRVAEPQTMVHAVAKDVAHAESVRQRELQRRLVMLRQVDLLAPLSDDEKNFVAERLQYAPFARGDIITKQGSLAHWLYIIAFGEAEVRYEQPGRAPRVLGTVRAGQFFGEMGLLAGDSRNATVIAKTDVECYRLDRASFQALLLARPELAQEVSKVVASRTPELETARAEAAQAPELPAEAAEPALLERIQKFFGLK
ncbi:MAG TPA: mechanosensitive ion channel family protein [Burkholderiales bacterium]|nr:mechanosensitive ion channel family protein [Burkholderiales bacterium]